MKLKIFILTFFLLMLANTIIAHQDFYKVKNFGKVKVRVKTGFDYEEINKAWIIGELTNRLLQRLNYNDSLFLDFSHHYISNCTPDYFISYDKGEIDYMTDEPIKTVQVSDVIVIRQVSSKFDILATLNLVEYSLCNIEIIASKQNKLEYTKNYCQWRINTIDTLITRNISNSKLSNNIKETLKGKVFIPKEKEDRTNEISYYFQNKKYFIYASKIGVTLIKLDDIYQFISIKNQDAMIFDTDTSFYFVQNSTPYYLSKRHIISTKRSFPWEIYDAKMYNDTIIITNFDFGGIEPKLLRRNRGVYICRKY